MVPYPLRDVYNEMHDKNGLRISSKIRKYFSGPWMKLIPKSFIQGRKFDVRFKNGEDSLFMFLISDNFKKFAFTSEEAIYYRRYREGSAVTRKRNCSEVLKTGMHQLGVYLIYFFRKPYRYNIAFFATRLLACIHGIIHNIR